MNKRSLQHMLAGTLIFSATSACKENPQHKNPIVENLQRDEINQTREVSSRIISESKPAFSASVNPEPIQEVKPFARPIRNRLRVQYYPMTHDANTMSAMLKNNEGLCFAEKDSAYMTSSGKRPRLRKTACEAYELAKHYAEMEGYGIAIFSGLRTGAEQRELYAIANKSDKVMKVAKEDESEHQRGAAADVLLFRKIKGETILLTPTKDGPGAGDDKDIERLMRYMNMAGFVNFSEEPWHFEIGSKDWAKIMKKQDLLGGLPIRQYIYPLID